MFIIVNRASTAALAACRWQCAISATMPPSSETGRITICSSCMANHRAASAAQVFLSHTLVSQTLCFGFAVLRSYFPQLDAKVVLAVLDNFKESNSIGERFGRLVGKGSSGAAKTTELVIRTLAAEIGDDTNTR